MLWNGGTIVSFAENDFLKRSGNIQTVAETTTSIQANHTAWLSLDFVSLSPDEEGTEITVPNKEGTLNTVWLCIVIFQLLAHFWPCFNSCTADRYMRPPGRA